MSWRCLFSVGLLLIASGCGDARPETPSQPPAPITDLGTNFDPASTGTLSGRVTWEGGPPDVPPLRIQVNPFGGAVLEKPQLRPNPNAPMIDTSTRGVEGAVVFLRGVDPHRSRPWDLPPVRVEQLDCQFHVRQGEVDGRVGFVRRGTAVELVSRDATLYSLHAGGAAFFTVVFPDPDQLLRRALDACGTVELTNGGGYYWMRAYVLVDEHPYYVRTDARGCFRLEQVPPGDYEVVCWLPSWRKARHERDPETGVVCRYVFEPPVERHLPVHVEPRGNGEVKFRLGVRDFEADAPAP